MEAVSAVADIVGLVTVGAFFFGAFVFPLGCTVLTKILEKS